MSFFLEIKRDGITILLGIHVIIQQHRDSKQ